MPDEYPLSTSQLVQIALKELAKPIPVLGNIVSAHSAFFSKIEQNRIKAMLAELFQRVEKVEELLGNQRNSEILLFACDVVRGDPLAGEKSTAYAGVVASLFDPNKGDMDAVVEILDNLRKLNLSDLKVLYRFKRANGSTLPMRAVADLQPGYDLNDVISQHRTQMEEVFPHVLRLESLGIVYRTSDDFLAGPVENIGGLSSELRKSVCLTASGRRLIANLPA